MKRLLNVPSKATRAELNHIDANDSNDNNVDNNSSSSSRGSNNTTLTTLSGNDTDEIEEKEEENNNDNNDKIILFVRLEGENYTCLGHVAHISYNLENHPIEFEWELLDYKSVVNTEYFKRILAS